jgi:AhpC/TSA family
MKRFLISAAIVLGAAALLSAADEPKKDTPATPSKPAEKSVAEQIKAVDDDAASKREELLKRFQEAKEQADKDKIRKELAELDTSSHEKYLAIARKHPGDQAAFQALQALLGSEKYAGDAIDLLIKHYLQNKDIGQACLTVAMYRLPAGEKLLRAVAEKGGSEQAKACAAVALGQLLHTQSEDPTLKPADRAKVRAEAEKSLQAVQKQYANVEIPFYGKAGDKARRELFELQHLAVGAQVPDIQGVDLDGKAFKLSDYRGKVVFLDFWAHW